MISEQRPIIEVRGTTHRSHSLNTRPQLGRLLALSMKPILPSYSLNRRGPEEDSVQHDRLQLVLESS